METVLNCIGWGTFGGLVGALLVIGALALYEAWKGPG